MTNLIEKMFRSYHSAIFSPCGGYLAVADRNGSIFVHKLSHLVRQIDPSADLSLENVVKLRPLVAIFDSKNKSNAKLLVWRDYLLCCFPNGQVNAYLWSDISKQRTTASWSRRFFDSQKQASSDSDEFGAWTTIVDQSGRELLIAAGSGFQSNFPILSWEFESAKVLNSYQGHDNSVYCLSPNGKVGGESTNEFLSAGEGGDVRLWDLRTSTNSIAVVKPFETDCARPDFGRWIGCLVGDGDWMVCGGGPQLGLWHIGSRSLVKPMTTSGSEVTEHHCGCIVDDTIITGGSGGNIFHWNYRGDSVAVMPTAPVFVHDLQCNAKSSNQNVLAAVGSGPIIDLYSNLIYRMTPVETIC